MSARDQGLIIFFLSFAFLIGFLYRMLKRVCGGEKQDESI